MPFPLLGLLIGAAAGGVKSGIEAGQESSDRDVQAATTAYSPWTGLKGAAPRRTNTFGNLLSGGLTGASFEQGLPSGGGGGGASTVGDAINPANASSQKTFGVGGGTAPSAFHLMDKTTPPVSPYSLLGGGGAAIDTLLSAPEATGVPRRPMGPWGAQQEDRTDPLKMLLSGRGNSGGMAGGMY